MEQSTAWTVMLEEVTANILTEVGAADGAGDMETLHIPIEMAISHLSPELLQ